MAEEYATILAAVNGIAGEMRGQIGALQKEIADLRQRQESLPDPLTEMAHEEDVRPAPTPITSDGSVGVACDGRQTTLSVPKQLRRGVRYAVAKADWGGDPNTPLSVKDIGPCLDGTCVPESINTTAYDAMVYVNPAGAPGGLIFTGDVLEVTELIKQVSGENYPVVYAPPAGATYGVVQTQWAGEITLSVKINGAGAAVNVPLYLMGGGSRPFICAGDLVQIVGGTAYVQSDNIPVGFVCDNPNSSALAGNPWWQPFGINSPYTVANFANASNGANAAACPTFGPTLNGITDGDLQGYLRTYTGSDHGLAIRGDGSGLANNDTTKEMIVTTGQFNSAAVGTPFLAVTKITSYAAGITTGSSPGYMTFDLPLAEIGAMRKVA